MCFTVIVNGDLGGYCCASQICVPVPDCSSAAGQCDLDGDGIVGVLDYLSVLDSWGPCEGCGACPADFDANCGVDITDILYLLANWS